jgi:hypothetical protein
MFKIAICAVFLPISAWAGGSNLADVLARSQQYAVEAPKCGLIDGYRCAKISEDKFLTRSGQAGLVSGNLLRAWQSAVDDFQSQPDQTREQTRLKHYKIGFTESAEHYIILFQALLLPIVEKVEGKTEVVGLLRETLGRTTKYWIKKENFQVDTRLFYK